MEADEKELTFEAALQELQDIIEKLEQGESSLEEALVLYERGQSLASYCNSKLEKASLRVESLTSDGEIVPIK